MQERLCISPRVGPCRRDQENVRVPSESSSVVPDVPVLEAWRRLADNPNSVLIDVRTRAEWNFVGVPDLGPLGKQTVFVEWLGFPDSRPNADFVTELTERLGALGAARDAELLFICRSGARSQSAAQAMTRAGFTQCCNVAEGFEGPLDGDRHRGVRSGWKAQALPWVQG